MRRSRSQAPQFGADTRTAMADNRASRGLVVSALAAAVLAVSVFSPWYSIGITSAGAAAAQQQLAIVAQQYGNASLQSMADEVGSQFSSVAGRQLATVSAHQALKDVSRLLLLLAAVALVASLLALAGVVEVGGGQIASSASWQPSACSIGCLPRQARTPASSRCRSGGAAGSRSSPQPGSSSEASGDPSPTRARRLDTTHCRIRLSSRRAVRRQARCPGTPTGSSPSSRRRATDLNRRGG